MHSIRPIVILGPTAGGKSDLAVEIAQRLCGEVVSADSMQVYRRMNAGTAKPPSQVRRRVPHHLIDVVEPTERFTVADWLTSAEALIDRMLQRSIRPIVVGAPTFISARCWKACSTVPAPTGRFENGPQTSRQPICIGACRRSTPMRPSGSIQTIESGSSARWRFNT